MSSDKHVEQASPRRPLKRLLLRCGPLNLLNAATPVRHLNITADVSYGYHARQSLDIYAPKELQAPAPVVVFFYGGRWIDGRKRDYLFAAQALASQGFVTVVPDYRLHPEVGYPDFLLDGAGALEWTTQNVDAFGGRADQIFVAGHSAGSYIAAMLTYDPRHIFETAAGEQPIKGMISLAGPFDFLPIDSPVVRRVFGEYHEDPTTQPANTATGDGPPALLLHGEADITVRPRNTHSLAARLRAQGGAVETKIYPNVGHIGIVLALTPALRRRTPVLSDMVAFIRNHSGAVNGLQRS